MTTHREYINYRNLDTKIAEEVMGWEFKGMSGYNIFCPPSTPAYTAILAISNSGNGITTLAARPIPHYTTNIEHAFSIIEHVRDRYEISVRTLAVNWYQCALDAKDGAVRYPVEVAHEGDEFANEETVPMAICMATYKAITGKDLILGW